MSRGEVMRGLQGVDIACGLEMMQVIIKGCNQQPVKVIFFPDAAALEGQVPSAAPNSELTSELVDLFGKQKVDDLSKF